MFIPGMSPAFAAVPGVAHHPVGRPLSPLTIGPELEPPSLPCFRAHDSVAQASMQHAVPVADLIRLCGGVGPKASEAGVSLYLTGKRESDRKGEVDRWRAASESKWSGRSGSTHERRCVGPLAIGAFPVRLRLCSEQQHPTSPARPLPSVAYLALRLRVRLAEDASNHQPLQPLAKQLPTG